MENALLIGLSRQMVLGRSMDVVANNIANMNTTGFKADNSLFEEYLMPVARENRFNPADRMVSFVNDSGAWHNLALTVAGTALTARIDGQPVASATDADAHYATGIAGIEAGATEAGGAWTGTSWPVVQYRNLTVTP